MAPCPSFLLSCMLRQLCFNNCCINIQWGYAGANAVNWDLSTCCFASGWKEHLANVVRGQLVFENFILFILLGFNPSILISPITTIILFCASIVSRIFDRTSIPALVARGNTTHWRPVDSTNVKELSVQVASELLPDRVTCLVI